MLNLFLKNFFKVVGGAFVITELININFALFLFGVSEKYLPIYVLTGWSYLPTWIQLFPVLHLFAMIPVFIMYRIYIRDFGSTSFTRWVKWAMIFDIVFLPLSVLMNMAG